MSLRPIRHAAALLLASLAFGAVPAAPALADGIIATPMRHHVRHHVRHAPRVATRIVYVPQPVPVYAASCGGCGGAVAYAPPPPPQYHYSGSCGGCGYGVAPMHHSYSGYVGSYRMQRSHSYRQRFSNYRHFHGRRGVSVRF